MSVNQSRGDKNEPPQYRKLGRSGNAALQRNYSGGGGRGGGGGGSTTAPPSSSSSSSNRSFKKVANYAQGVRPRVNSPNTNSNPDLLNSSTPGGTTVPNGAHLQPPPRGASGAPAAVTAATIKPSDVPTQKSTPGLPRAPQGNAAVSGSDATGPSTPTKGPADASRPFPLQFGSISPGLMNGMQIPARTSSAPPNLDEQKQAQARLEALKPTKVSTPAVLKQQLPKKDAGTIDQSNATEAHSVPKAKKDVQALATPPATQSQKLYGPSIPGVSMQMPFHHSPLHVPYGGPNPQMQSQGMANSSLPMPLPIPLSMGNPPQVPQQVFVAGLQHHQMQPQGIIHQGQGQGLNFQSQMGPPQMPPQLGNIGMGLGQHYSPQQTGKLGAHRKAVKITHPDTHEELRLDKRSDGYADGGSKGSGPRPHPHALPQSQQIPTFPPGRVVNYYSNSYNANPLSYQPTTSNPLTSAQTTPGSQAPRFYSQATVKPAANTHEKVSDSSLPGSTPAIDKNELPKTPRTHGETSSVHSQREPETSSGSSTQHPNSTLSPMATKPSNATFGSFQSENLTNNSSTATVEDSVPLVNSEAEVAKEAMVSKSSFFKEEQVKPVKKVQSAALDQVGGQSASISTSVLETVKSSTPSTGAKEEVSETIKKVVPVAVTVSAPLKGRSVEEGLKSTETIGNETNSDSSPKIEEPKAEPAASEEQGNVMINEPEKHEVAKSASDQNRNSGAMEVTVTKIETGSLDAAAPAINDDKSLPSASAADIDILNAETSSLSLGGDDISSSDASLSRFGNKGADDAGNRESGMLDHGSAAVSISVPDRPPSVDGEDTGNRASLISPTLSGSMDKTLSDTNKAKSNTSKPKKRRKDILKFADAQGTTSDLYMAYKGPEEKKESPSIETVENSSDITQKQASVDSSEKDIPCDEKRGRNKFEPEDWEDAADISTPKLETSVNGKQVDGMAKKYSRDFLLKFAEQCLELPQGFELTPDTAEVVTSNVNVSRESYPSPGRGGDRGPAGARLDRRPSNVGHDDRWNKQQGPMGPGRMQIDTNYAGNQAGFRPSGGGNFGVLRGRPQGYAGGILSGPMQSPGPHMQRNNSDSDRWQRVAGNQKGLIPSPQTPMQVMHKAERKYEVGKVTDEEQAKQRQLKGILNKLTPQNFEKLFEQVKQVNIDNAGTLSGVINQIFDKALMEPTFCEMYANFCSRLAVELPDFSEDNEKITFKRLLLNKCQEEFERGEREEEEANRTEEEGEVKQTEEEREEKRIKARRRMLGNIRLIGELYKKKMLTERIMHECIKKLLGQYQNKNPDEEDIEALCKLMSTIGVMIDHPKAKEHMDVYFDTMYKLSNNMKLSSRVRFMLKDAIDLRKNKWQQRRKVEGPKKIDEVHRDAAQERHAQSSRMARGSSFNSSTRSRQPMEFAPRGSNVLPSPNAQMGSFRGLQQQQPRGYVNQDARVEERASFENRAISITLRPSGDDPLPLVPQGGLARGMSGQPSMQSMALPEVPSPADPRRVAAGPNGYGSGLIPERQSYGPRDEFVPRYSPERLAPSPAYDQSHVNRNPEHSFDRGMPSSPSPRVWMPTPSPNVPADKVWPEERLRDKSMEAIKEFYSARDEKEVALCIKELNAPGFYPSMISIWISDSFERKDVDRDALAKLLVNLTKYHDGILSQESLLRGLESVLATLEDCVNDAPKAAEYLGRVVGKMLLEKVIAYKEVWQLIYEGGEEAGRLVEIGLAADVVGVILEMIASEKGDVFLKEIRAGSNLHVEEFRPPNSKKASRLDKFI